MPLTGYVAAGQSANTYMYVYAKLQSFYSKKRSPDGVNRNAYNFFLESQVTARSSTFKR